MSHLENSEELTTIDHLFERAHNLRKLGGTAEAQAVLAQAVDICRGMPNPDPTRTALVLDEMGTVAFWNGTHSEAEQYYTEALQVQEAATHPGHGNLAPLLDHLAHLYIHMDRFDKAAEAARRALSIRQATMLTSDASTVENMRMCAIIELELGNLDEAQSLIKKAIAILEPATIGPFEEFVYLLASVYKMQGKNAEAEACYKRALITFAHRRGRPARHASCMQDYAQFLRQLGRVKDAERLEALLPALIEAVGREEATGTHEINRDLPDTDVYQVLPYPVTIFH